MSAQDWGYRSLATVIIHAVSERTEPRPQDYPHSGLSGIDVHQFYDLLSHIFQLVAQYAHLHSPWFLANGRLKRKNVYFSNIYTK